MTTAEWIAKRIISLCKERNISINKLAMLSGITQSTLNSIIHGESKNPRLVTIKKISEALGITTSDFFRDMEKTRLEDD